MNRKTFFKKWLLLVAVGLIHLSAKTQVPSLSPVNGVVPAIFNSAGGTYDVATSYYRFEWSFGELLVIQAMAPADSTVLLTHGVLQPCTDFNIKSPQTIMFESGEYKLFPNPTTAKFELDFFVRESGQMKLQLINSVGQLLESRSYHYDGCCRIDLFDLSRYPDGSYFIVADLAPDSNDGTGFPAVRHSGFKVIKIRTK